MCFTSYLLSRDAEECVGFTDLGQQGASRSCLARIVRDNSSLSSSYSSTSLEWMLENLSSTISRTKF